MGNPKKREREDAAAIAPPPTPTNTGELLRQAPPPRPGTERVFRQLYRSERSTPYGLQFHKDLLPLKVKHVRPGTPGDLCGVRDGDVVVLINGEGPRSFVAAMEPFKTDMAIKLHMDRPMTPEEIARAAEAAKAATAHIAPASTEAPAPLHVEPWAAKPTTAGILSAAATAAAAPTGAPHGGGRGGSSSPPPQAAAPPVAAPPPPRIGTPLDASELSGFAEAFHSTWRQPELDNEAWSGPTPFPPGVLPDDLVLHVRRQAGQPPSGMPNFGRTGPDVTENLEKRRKADKEAPAPPRRLLPAAHLQVNLKGICMRLFPPKDYDGPKRLKAHHGA